MIEFLGPGGWDEITRSAVACLRPARVAVAYYSDINGTMLPLQPGSKLVVDASPHTVSTGGTSPRALLKQIQNGVKVYSLKNLHSKIYLFDKCVFVGSPNVSPNSRSRLFESSIKSSHLSLMNSCHQYIESICLSRLKREDVEQLQDIYRPPVGIRHTGQSDGRNETLIMELTLEMGANRITQVQPPTPVWDHFLLAVGRAKRPTHLALKNSRSLNARSVRRLIVTHDHNLTVEIPEAILPRPAILCMTRVGLARYEYAIWRPQDTAYHTFRRLLDTRSNPMQGRGRRWIIL